METLTKPRTGSRRKVHQDQTPKEAKPKSNVADAGTVLVYLGKITEQEAAVALQKKKLAKLWKLAILEGIVRKDLELVRKLADMDPDTVLGTLNNIKSYAVAMDLPIGTQLSLLDIPGATILSEKELNERAHRAGFFHGATGKDRDLQAYPTDNAQHQRYMQGYNEGQGIWLSRIKTIDIAMDSESKATAETAEEPELEEA